MPRYFFNLSFGQRVVPDEEGVELPNRSAARNEALAVIRDLANPKIGGGSRRWASWFLELADDRGRFFRMPIGQPALEVITPDGLERRGEEPVSIRPVVTALAPDAAQVRARTAAIVQEMGARQADTVRLLKVNHRLRDELLYICRASEGIRVRTSRLVAVARGGGR